MGMMMRFESELTQHCGKYHRCPVKESNQNEREEERNGELTTVVTSKDIGGAKGVLDRTEALPEPKCDNDNKTNH